MNMTSLSAVLTYKGVRINKIASSTGFFYKVRMVPFLMTSLSEAKSEINKIIDKKENK